MAKKVGQGRQAQRWIFKKMWKLVKGETAGQKVDKARLKQIKQIAYANARMAALKRGYRPKAPRERTNVRKYVRSGKYKGRRAIRASRPVEGGVDLP